MHQNRNESEYESVKVVKRNKILGKKFTSQREIFKTYVLIDTQAFAGENGLI